MTTPITGPGTSESQWLPWLSTHRWDDLDLNLFRGRRLVVVAAHPDDEVLGVGGLLRRVAPVVSGIDMVWATDGEASHAGASHPLVARLATLRPMESDRALTALGIAPASRLRLRLPDSGLPAHEDAVAAHVRDVTTDDCVLLAPWAGDGHPDHEVCGRAARRASSATGALLFEYPVWAWHWAGPDMPGMPWERARRVGLLPADREAKLAAIGAFATQVLPLGPAADEAPVLPAHVVVRFLRDMELVFAWD